MTVEEIIRRIAEESPLSQDSEWGPKCFFCAEDSIYGKIATSTAPGEPAHGVVDGRLVTLRSADVTHHAQDCAWIALRQHYDLPVPVNIEGNPHFVKQDC